VHSAPPPEAAASAAASNAALQLKVSEASWIEVLDGTGQTLLSRTVLPGESVGIDGALPLRVKVGNAVATRVVFRGQALDLAPSTRDNVARIELK
jgi:cytoskeleton protein RodZ